MEYFSNKVQMGHTFQNNKITTHREKKLVTSLVSSKIYQQNEKFISNIIPFHSRENTVCRVMRYCATT